jgi:uncharacterized protein YecE (DUF72 family)
MAEARIGTSGWIYRHWRRGAFYPEGLRQKLEFQHYASLFDTVEINGSFYRTPGERRPASGATRRRRPSCMRGNIRAG